MAKVQGRFRAVCHASVVALAVHPLVTLGQEPQSFDLVRAILSAKCLACHGNDPKDLKGDYDLRTCDAAIKGGESGEAAIVPGQPEKSPLFRAITWQDDALQMPPKENDRLTPEQIAVIRRWIASGAKWETPTATAKEWTAGSGGVRIATSGGQSGEWNNRTYDVEAVWAYQPARHSKVPEASAHPVDAFLLNALRAKKVAGFAAPATRATLVRRLAFDLTGLPPAAQTAFATAPKSDVSHVTSPNDTTRAPFDTMSRAISGAIFGSSSWSRL